MSLCIIHINGITIMHSAHSTFVIDSVFCGFQIRLLKDILDAWKSEVEKKPPTMSISEAYETLELPSGVGRSVIFQLLSVVFISDNKISANEEMNTSIVNIL